MQFLVKLLRSLPIAQSICQGPKEALQRAILNLQIQGTGRSKGARGFPSCRFATLPYIDSL